MDYPPSGTVSSVGGLQAQTGLFHLIGMYVYIPIYTHICVYIWVCVCKRGRDTMRLGTWMVRRDSNIEGVLHYVDGRYHYSNDFWNNSMNFIWHLKNLKPIMILHGYAELE